MKLSWKFTVKGCIKYDLFLYNLVSGETGHCQLGIAKSVSPPPVLRVASEAHSDKGPYFMTADDGIFLEKCILPDISFLFLLYLPPSPLVLMCSFASPVGSLPASWQSQHPIPFLGGGNENLSLPPWRQESACLHIQRRL